MPTDRPDPAGELTRLPAERRRKDDGVVLYACCCCCCCCCLHTVGGAIGAVLSGNYRGTAPRESDAEGDGFYDDEDDFDDLRRGGYGRRLPGVQGLFWTSVLIVILLQVVVTVGVGLAQGAEPKTLFMITPCALIMLGPLYFVAACAVLLIRVGIDPALRQDGGYFHGTLRVFLGTLAGTVVGLLVMAAPFLFLAAIK